MATYHNIGYQVISTSATRNTNLDTLKNILKGKINLITGHSGVGKSTLINAIAPGFNLRVSEISESHQSGKHTTTYAQMLELPFGGYIIDSPGIKAFGIVDIKKEEIYHFFPEIFKIAKNCKYHNCLHINEPECAVKKAVDSGDIFWTRYKSYLNIVLDDNDKHRLKEV